MKILSNKQYEAIIYICREADQEIVALKGQVDDLLKQNNKLRKENERLSRDLRDLQNFCINFAADQKAKAIDFPNSVKEYVNEEDFLR